MDEGVSSIKRATTLEEQLCLLKERGLIITDEAEAMGVLKNISYYRLSAYMLTYKRSDKFYPGISLDTIMDTYYFDEELRQLLLNILGTIEISVRSIIVNYIALKYGPFGHLDPMNFTSTEYFNEFKMDLDKCIDRSKNEPFINHHLFKYQGQIPIWAAAEVVTFGMVSKMYSNMIIADRKIIAKEINTNYLLLDSWLLTLSILRNRCSHHNRIYNRLFTKRPMIHSKYNKLKIDDMSLFALLLAAKDLFFDKDRWDEHMVFLNDLVKEYQIRVDYLGFTPEWKELLVFDKELIKFFR